MFSCEICADGLREYKLVLKDDGVIEVCASCYETIRVPERDHIKTATRFAGLTPLKGTV